MRLIATRQSATGWNYGAIASPPPTIRTAAFIGSSSVEFNQSSGSGGNNRFFSNEGFAVWCCAYLRQRMMLAYNPTKKTYEFGLFGATNATIRSDSRLTPAAIAAQPDVAFLYVSLNDLGGGSQTAAQMLASTQAIYNDLIAGGVKKVVIIAPGPRNATAEGGTGYWSRQQGLIALLVSWTTANGIAYFDPNPTIQNPVNGDWRAGFDRDGVHQSDLGAAHFGKALSTWCLTNLNLGPEPFAHAPRIANLKGVNPFNTGGGATLAASYSNFPGSRATPFLENATDGGARWQGQTIFSSTNATSDANGTQINVTSATLAAAGLATGQLIRHWIEVDLGNAGIQRFAARSGTNGTGINRGSGIDGGAQVSATIAPPAHADPVVFVGPVMQIPSDATTYGGVVWVIGHMQNVSTTWKFRYHGCEVVSSYNPPSIGS